jgi:hypothetical protein
MMSLQQIMQHVQQGMTKDEADAILKEQVAEIVALGDIDEKEATRRVLANIGYFAGYYGYDTADKAYDLFGTEHPVWGREHPTPSEILQMGIEYGQRVRERRKFDDPGSN